MPIDLTARNHELETLRLTHEPFVQTSQRSELIPSAPVEPEMAPSDESATRTPEIGIILGLAILVFFLLRGFGVLREDERVIKHGVKTPPCQDTPCPSCHFFSKNAYLKCAVRPSDVLTHRAIHCPDYCLAHQERSKKLTVPPKQDLDD